MPVKRLTHSAEPAEYRCCIEDNLIVIGESNGRNDVMQRVFELSPQRSFKFRCGEKGFKHSGNVAVGLAKAGSNLLNQLWRRIIRDEIDCELVAYEAGSCRRATEQI